MSDDVLTLIKTDHQAAETLLRRFDVVPASGRREYFYELVPTLVGHEVAEELIVYPVIASDGEVGADVAEERLDEQAEAEQLLADMEGEDISGPEFTALFKAFRAMVLAHAKAEEATVFPLVESSTDAAQRRDLGARYIKAKEAAPTHPRPSASDRPPANNAIGPVATIFDRAREAVLRA